MFKIQHVIKFLVIVIVLLSNSDVVKAFNPSIRHDNFVTYRSNIIVSSSNISNSSNLPLASASSSGAYIELDNEKVLPKVFNNGLSLEMGLTIEVLLFSCPKNKYKLAPKWHYKYVSTIDNIKQSVRLIRNVISDKNGVALVEVLLGLEDVLETISDNDEKDLKKKITFNDIKVALEIIIELPNETNYDNLHDQIQIIAEERTVGKYSKEMSNIVEKILGIYSDDVNSDPITITPSDIENKINILDDLLNNTDENYEGNFELTIEDIKERIALIKIIIGMETGDDIETQKIPSEEDIYGKGNYLLNIIYTANLIEYIISKVEQSYNFPEQFPSRILFNGDYYDIITKPSEEYGDDFCGYKKYFIEITKRVNGVIWPPNPIPPDPDPPNPIPPEPVFPKRQDFGYISITRGQSLLSDDDQNITITFDAIHENLNNVLNTMFGPFEIYWTIDTDVVGAQINHETGTLTFPNKSPESGISYIKIRADFITKKPIEKCDNYNIKSENVFYRGGFFYISSYFDSKYYSYTSCNNNLINYECNNNYYLFDYSWNMKITNTDAILRNDHKTANIKFNVTRIEQKHILSCDDTTNQIKRGKYYWSLIQAPDGAIIDSVTGDLTLTVKDMPKDYFENIQVLATLITKNPVNAPGNLLIVPEPIPYNNEQYYKTNINKLYTKALKIPRIFKTYYVDQNNGSDENDGLSIVSAFKTITKAYDMASSYTTIKVAAGTYTQSLIIDKNIKLISLHGASKTFLTSPDGARPLVFKGGLNHRTVLEGFTIKNVNINGIGAILCEDASPIINYCIFENNSSESGGGMGLTLGSNVLIKNTVFKNNHALKYGGAIYVDTGSSLTLWTSKILDNTAVKNGAGIYSVPGGE